MVCLSFIVVMVRFNAGTVLVRPEPVDNGKDEFRGPEFHSRKSRALRKDFSRRCGGQSLLVFINQHVISRLLLQSITLLITNFHQS